MNGQRLNTKDRNSQKDAVDNLMVYPNKRLSVGGSFIRRARHAIGGSQYSGVKAGENCTKKRQSLGGVVTTSAFSSRTEYLTGKDKSVRSEGFYVADSVCLLRDFGFITSFDYFSPSKAIDFKRDSYIAGLQYRFYLRCRMQA